MSVSVNNREAQLRGGYLDMIAESNDNWDESLTEPIHAIDRARGC